MGVIDEIVAQKGKRLKEAMYARGIGELKSLIAGAEPPRDFKAAITRAGRDIKLIAELKKASPSKGLIRPDFDPTGIARTYSKGGASALSVLTEQDYFQGDLSYIAMVKATCDLPVLRKDFIFDEYQVYEARAAGADAFLLIESILDVSQAGEYLHMARELGMAVLFETHDERGLEKALKAGADIIGINNRDLRTLEMDPGTTFRLIKEIPEGKVVVSESGIGKGDDVLKLQEAGVDAILVGTALMRSGDIGAAMRELLGH